VHVRRDRERRRIAANARRAAALNHRTDKTIMNTQYLRKNLGRGRDRTRERSGAPRPTRLAPSITIALGVALALMAALPGAAAAARVSGTFATYQGQPAASRDLHFENCVTHDTYMAPTHRDGSFAQMLPPGCYDLRAERGAIVRHAIMVGKADVAVGQVSDLSPFAPARLCQLEALFPTLLTSPAPSTAYIFTRDTTVVPASAPVVPMPSSQSEWLKLKNQPGAAATSSNRPAPEFNEPMDFGAPHPTGPTAPANPNP